MLPFHIGSYFEAAPSKYQVANFESLVCALVDPNSSESTSGVPTSLAHLSTLYHLAAVAEMIPSAEVYSVNNCYCEHLA